jgi:hypothetical protein
MLKKGTRIFSVARTRHLLKGSAFKENEPFAGSNAAMVDVKDGKIVKIRPLHFDWKYKPEDMNPCNIKARGKIFEPGIGNFRTPFLFTSRNNFCFC